jgi:hypothetical protein
MRGQEGFSHEKFIENYSNKIKLVNLPAKELLKTVYTKKYGKSEQNPNGLTPEQIETDLSKMSVFDLEERAGAIRNELKKALFKVNISEDKKTEMIKTANETLEQKAIETANLFAKETEIDGIPYNEEDKKAFGEFFKDVSKINPETGRPYFWNILNDDQNLFKSLYLLWKAEGTEENIKSWLSDFKEAYKSEILNKTRVNQRTESGNTRQVSVMKPEDYV